MTKKADKSQVNLELTQYPFQHRFTPRWRDNDIYGHINNAVYYEYFDSTANLYLIEQAGLNIHQADTVAFVVYSQCQYMAPVTYPNKINIGLAIKKLGNSSITWQLGMFSENDNETKATAEFVHVFVDRQTGEKTTIPNSMREALTKLLLQ